MLLPYKMPYFIATAIVMTNVTANQNYLTASRGPLVQMCTQLPYATDARLHIHCVPHQHKHTCFKYAITNLTVSGMQCSMTPAR